MLNYLHTSEVHDSVFIFGFSNVLEVKVERMINDFSLMGLFTYI